MAKYKPHFSAQGQFLPVFFNKQIQENTFEYSLSYLVDNELDLSIFDHRFNNDETGAPAYDPRILLKVVLFAYSAVSPQTTQLPAAARRMFFSRHCLQTAILISPPLQILFPLWIRKLPISFLKFSRFVISRN